MRGGVGGGGDTQAAPAAKASLTGPLLAFDALRQPVWAPRDYAAFAREGFAQNAIVYRAVRMIAEAAASVPLLLYEGDEEIAGHPLLDLLARPNPVSSAPDLLESWYGFLLVSGNAYLEAVAAGGRLRELHALRPDRIKVVPGPDGWPEAFDYTAGGRSVRFSGEVVPGVRPILHVKLFHPANDHYGMSPIEAAATAIDIHNTASKWNKALLDNSARPSGALVYTARDGNLSVEQYDRLKAELEQGFQGAAHAGRPLLLEGGLDWKSMSLSPKDMDFIEAKHVAAREIALALGVPPMLLGIPGDNTYGDDPYDPGGPTNLGITLAVYARYKGVDVTADNIGALKSELKQIPVETAGRIYRSRYWLAAQCPQLAAPLAVFHFDTAVNHGVDGAARMLQQSVGADVDGEIGRRDARCRRRQAHPAHARHVRRDPPSALSQPRPLLALRQRLAQACRRHIGARHQPHRHRPFLDVATKGEATHVQRCNPGRTVRHRHRPQVVGAVHDHLGHRRHDAVDRAARARPGARPQHHLRAHPTAGRQCGRFRAGARRPCRHRARHLRPRSRQHAAGAAPGNAEPVTRVGAASRAARPPCILSATGKFGRESRWPCAFSSSRMIAISIVSWSRR